MATFKAVEIRSHIPHDGTGHPLSYLATELATQLELPNPVGITFGDRNCLDIIKKGKVGTNTESHDSEKKTTLLISAKFQQIRMIDRYLAKTQPVHFPHFISCSAFI